MADVFISYCRSAETSELVRRIAEKLESRGISCWYAERDILPGGDFAGEIPLQIYVCKVFLPILDKSAANSLHMENEMAIAYEAHHYRYKEPIIILPIFMLEDMDELVERIEKILSSQHPESRPRPSASPPPPPPASKPASPHPRPSASPRPLESRPPPEPSPCLKESLPPPCPDEYCTRPSTSPHPDESLPRPEPPQEEKEHINFLSFIRQALFHVNKVIRQAPFHVDKVQFSAVAPEGVAIGKPSIVRLFIYAKDFIKEVNQIIRAEKVPMTETKSGSFRIAKNAKVNVVLSAPDISLYHVSEKRVWIGEYLQYTVPVIVPETYDKDWIQFDAKVYVEGVCRVCLAFVANCASTRTQRMEITRRDIHSAFISYARENMREVVGRIQTIQKLMPDLDLFFDKDNIQSGEYWEDVLKWEIATRDILYLFWSKAASESKWVEKEWRYALKVNGLDGIDPFPIEKIPPCPSPPEELSAKHFQDKWLHFQ